MLRFFKNNRQQEWLKNGFLKYLFYAIGEVLLVVIGILIALKINNWNTAKLDSKSEIQLLQHIKQQITEDSNALVENKEKNSYFFTQYLYANEIIKANDRSQLDTLAHISMNLSQYSDFNHSANIYETLVNSGNLKLIKNPEIPAQLQQLEMTYNHINKLEDIHWEIIIKELSPEMKGVINYATMEVMKPDQLFGVALQNILIESVFLTKGKEAVYQKALNEITQLQELITKELQKNK